MEVGRAIRLIGAVAAVSVLAVACRPTDDDPADGDGRDAAVYEAILGWMIDEEPVTEPDERLGWTLFVASRYEEPIGVGVQVLVVEALDDRIDVRFIDERTEAVDDGDDDQPVRDDGMLVGLGAIPSDGDRVEVYVDRYRHAGDIAAWEVTLRRSGERWALVGGPTPTDVRPLPSGD